MAFVDAATAQTTGSQFQPQQSFLQRLLNFQITLAPNPANNQPSTFDSTGNNTAMLSGFRATVAVQNAGAFQGSIAEVMIWGLPQDLMNQLSTLGAAYNLVNAKNTVTIYAGSSDTFTAGVPAVAGSQVGSQSLVGFTPVFTGTIYLALPDYNQQPDVPMRFMCSGLVQNVVNAAPSSFPQSVDVATVMAGFASKLGLGFENNNINITLPPSYFAGTLWDQVQKLAHDAHIKAEIVPGAGNPSAGAVLTIYPIGGSRTSLGAGPYPLVGPTTGMIGYPSFANNSWIVVRMIFNPKIASLGTTFQLQTSIPQINNKAVVIYNLGFNLESLVPKGKWEATATCYPKGLLAPPLPQQTAG